MVAGTMPDDVKPRIAPVRSTALIALVQIALFRGHLDRRSLGIPLTRYLRTDPDGRMRFLSWMINDEMGSGSQSG